MSGAKSTIRVSVKRLAAARTTPLSTRLRPEAARPGPGGRTARRAPLFSAARPASRGARRRRRPGKSRAPRTSLTRPTPPPRPRHHVDQRSEVSNRRGGARARRSRGRKEPAALESRVRSSKQAPQLFGRPRHVREAGLGLGASEFAEELREDVRVFWEGYEFLVGVPKGETSRLVYASLVARAYDACCRRRPCRCNDVSRVALVSQ